MIQLRICPLEMMQVIINMATFYRYDLSESMAWPIEDDGMHRCYGLEEYWENNNLAFLIYLENELAGFALVNTKGVNKYKLGEFFILRKFRTQGLGREAAITLFERYKGEWMLEQLLPNKTARIFWQKTLTSYMPDNFTTEIVRNRVFGQIEVIRFSNLQKESI